MIAKYDKIKNKIPYPPKIFVFYRPHPHVSFPHWFFKKAVSPLYQFFGNFNPTPPHLGHYTYISENL